MDPNEKNSPEHPDDLEDEALDQPGGAGEIDGGNDDEDIHEAHIPVKGDKDLANDLAKKAYGDKDADGRGDAPNAQFP